MKKQIFLSTLCVTTALCSLPSVAWGMKEEDRQDPFLIISNKNTQEEKTKNTPRKLTGRFFTIRLLDGEARLYEEKVPGNGDCGYLALGTNRQDATQLLLENIHLEEIRRLIAPEIYDMLSQLPKKHPVVRLQGYQLNLAQQEILTEHYKKICTNLNDLLKRTEKDGREDEKLWEYCKQNLGTIQQNSKQSQSYEAFKSLREQIQQNEEERMQFCSQQETIKCYIKNFMQIPVNEYPILYGYDDNNWLNCSTIRMSNGQYRTNAINAIAYLLGKNLVIVTGKQIGRASCRERV